MHAGYLLMKAPNLTHKVRYLQSLRNRLPENSPFFDIVHLKKSPLEQNIHHLAIQCGENHIAPLTKNLLTLLNGPGGALFLPCVVLGNLQSDQIKQYFTTHDNYVKSLRSITLSPMVTNLDTIRKEYLPNGETVESSTREWATQLILTSSGENARCDIVNGGTDRTTSLLVPRHNFEEVLQEVSKDKLQWNVEKQDLGMVFLGYLRSFILTRPCNNRWSSWTRWLKRTFGNQKTRPNLKNQLMQTQKMSQLENETMLGIRRRESILPLRRISQIHREQHKFSFRIFQGNSDVPSIQIETRRKGTRLLRIRIRH